MNKKVRIRIAYAHFKNRLVPFSNIERWSLEKIMQKAQKVVVFKIKLNGKAKNAKSVCKTTTRTYKPNKFKYGDF